MKKKNEATNKKVRLSLILSRMRHSLVSFVFFSIDYLKSLTGDFKLIKTSLINGALSYNKLNHFKYQSEH